MRIAITNDNQNWLNWGKLVNLWIDEDIERPETVGALRQQLVAHGVDAQVNGGDEREVIIDVYGPDDTDPLVLKLPNRTMRAARLAEVKAGIYKPLPLFYEICFGGAKRVPLSEQEAKDFAIRRIGEYTVNECC